MLCCCVCARAEVEIELGVFEVGLCVCVCTASQRSPSAGGGQRSLTTDSCKMFKSNGRVEASNCDNRYGELYKLAIVADLSDIMFPSMHFGPLQRLSALIVYVLIY